ncbi:lasso RiPP family leader peptide-containing protein [Cytobacillus firmus]
MEYSTPKFVEYGSAVDLTKGSLQSQLAEGTDPWTGYRRS